MPFRPFDPTRDAEAAHRIWRECGWLEDDDDAPAMNRWLGAGRSQVAELHGEAECLVVMADGDIRYRHETLPFSLVAAVTTSRVARRQGLARRLTARCIAEDAANGAAVSGLGMFEQGFYNRLGFGSGGYSHLIAFDPGRLRLPGRVKRRPPRRVTAADHEAVHANRLERRRGHGACSIHHGDMTRGELEWGKRGFGLGFFDGPGGTLSHHMWMRVRGDAEVGPYSIFWLAYRTYDELLELLGVLHALSDQIRLVRMHEPVGFQIQDLLEQPMRARSVTEKSNLAQRMEYLAWWQMRICDLGRCLERTRLSGGSARFNLELSDPIEAILPDDSPWRGVAGRSVVTLGPSSGAEPGHDASLPTMTASVNAFTRMWLGILPASGLAATDELAAPPDLLEALDDVLRLPEPQPDWDF